MTDQRVACPRCGQDWLDRVRLVALEIDAIMCPECEALWLRVENIAPPVEGSYDHTWFDYSTFMEGHGRKNPQSPNDLQVLGPLFARS